MSAVLLTFIVLIVLPAALRGKVSLRLQYALWLLVAVQLLVPVEIGHSAISVLTLAGRAQHASIIQTVRDGTEIRDSFQKDVSPQPTLPRAAAADSVGTNAVNFTQAKGGWCCDGTGAGP